MTNRAGVMEKVCNKGGTRNICEIQRPKFKNADKKNDVRRIGDMMLRAQNVWLTNAKKSAIKFDF